MIEKFKGKEDNLEDYHYSALAPDAIHPWSTDWDEFQSDLFAIPEHWHDLSHADYFFKRVLGIPGSIRPIAFFPDLHDPQVLVEIRGQYYELNTMFCYVVRYGGGFSSPDEFLRLLPTLRAEQEDLTDTNEFYAKICREQGRASAKYRRAQKRKLRA